MKATRPLCVALHIACQFPDGSGDGAVRRMGAVLKTAICFNQFPIVYDDLHHTAGIGGAAIAGEENFLFHITCPP